MITKTEQSNTGSAQQIVLYAKRDPDSTTAYPVIIDENGSLSVETEQLTTQLNQIQNAIAAIRSTIGIAADLRVTLLSGIVTTVSSVTNVASLGGINGIVPMNALMNLAYIQSNGNNIA